ncbi:MAG: Smr/MutS family protein [Candidatus Eremiobacteraeota bacterium]|nr:Smr/MutS family protein [Candidatus Eremiobacteraeota bacterium]
MVVDRRTLEALDFGRVRERVVAATRSARGRATAEELLPFDDFERVRVEQSRTSAVRDLVAGADLYILPAIDTAELTQAAAVGRSLAPADLRAIGETIAACAAAYQSVRECVELTPVIAPYTPLRDVQRAVLEAIDERGAVLDRASPALGRIRRSLAQANADARERVSAILKSAKYAKAIQDSVVTIREGRFVVPVKAEFSGALPGIVHDTSSSGQTLFVEPLAALETNNRVRTLRIEEEREVQRILEELSQRVGTQAAAIEANVDMLAAVDVLVAKAQVARSMDATAPFLSDDPCIVVERGRHPLLGERAVPQSLALDATTRLLVISGPNMGGKSVALKMVGLLVAMTYCGMHVPAAVGTTIGRFECAIADIGDEQSIADNASTFSAHLKRMREMLERAGGRTLVMIDEIGGGTEPTAGAALAIAMLERLLESGARAIVTTHATELKLFAHATPGVANASVRFDPDTFAPTFALDVGAPGQSLAFPLAHALGIDPPIVERAQQLLDTRERDYESALAELSMHNAALQVQRERLEAERADAAVERDRLQRDRSAFESQRRAFGEKADERVGRALRDFVRELERRQAERGANARAKVTASQSALLAQTLDAIHRDLGIAPEVPDASDAGGVFEPGDPVYVPSLNQRGTVAEDYGDTVLVAIGPMKTVVKKSETQRVSAASLDRARDRLRERRLEPSGAAARLTGATRTPAELDVRGKRYAEAEPVVERWIDEATLAGNTQLRLIHGKGTGMLGRGLQEYLRAHPSVKSVRYGNENEGSSGVTIVELQ